MMRLRKKSFIQVRLILILIINAVSLEYRSLRFETEVLDTPNYQGVAVVNYTDRETPYTRIIEHKHFAFGQQEKTVITREYPAVWRQGMEAYYPVNNERNGALVSTV